MLLKNTTLQSIREGRVDLQFRVWKRPTVKAGGTLTTSVGVLRITEVESTSQSKLTVELARRAGFATRKSLIEALAGREGQLYRIGLRYEGTDPRLELRTRGFQDAEEQEKLLARLGRMDRSAETAWTERYLRLIAAHEGIRAPDLAAGDGLETAPFKARVRRLKALGLTESLRVGYRISPRGRAVLDALED